VADILRPDPGGFQELHGVHQFSVEAKVSWILKITIPIFLSLSRGMAIVIDMFIIIGALPEADVIDDQFQIALHCFSDRLQGFELTVDMLINDDFLDTHVFILKGFPYGVDPGCRGDFHLEAGKTFPRKVHEVGDTHRNRISAGMVNPFQKLNKLSIAFFRILEVSKARSIEEIAKFQSPLMAGVDVLFHILSVNLWQHETRSRPTDDIKGKLTEKSIDGCSFDTI
jgi:hypothetical protein